MRAREIMTKSVLTVQPTATVGKASEMLTYRGFSALPVVDEEGALVGIVTEADLIRNRFPQHSDDPAAAGSSECWGKRLRIRSASVTMPTSAPSSSTTGSALKPR